MTVYEHMNLVRQLNQCSEQIPDEIKRTDFLIDTFKHSQAQYKYF